MNVQQHEAADLLIDAAQAARQLAQQRQRDAGGVFEDALEVLAPQHEQRRVFHRNDVRRARLVIDESHLAEELAFAEHGENDLSAVFSDEDDLHLPLRNDVQRIAGIVFEQDDGILGVGSVASDFYHPLQIDRSELAEHRNLLLHLGRGHSDAPWFALSLWCLASRVNRTSALSLAPKLLCQLYFRTSFRPTFSKDTCSETRDTPQIPTGDRPVRVWKHVHHPLDNARNPRRSLCQLPSLLHRQAEARRHGRPRGALPPKVRNQGSSRSELSPWRPDSARRSRGRRRSRGSWPTPKPRGTRPNSSSSDESMPSSMPSARRTSAGSGWPSSWSRRGRCWPTKTPSCRSSRAPMSSASGRKSIGSIPNWPSCSRPAIPSMIAMPS